MCIYRSADCSITWAGPGQLAITTGELAVRIWNLHTGDNFVLSGATTASGSTAEFITSLAYSTSRAVLAAGILYLHLYSNYSILSIDTHTSLQALA